MSKCVSPYTGDNRNLTQNEERVADLLKQSYDIFKKDSILRHLLTHSSAGGNVGMQNWKAWIDHFTGVGDHRVVELRIGDVERALAEMIKVQKAIKRTSKEDLTGLRAKMKKLATLPVDVHRLAGLGDIHLTTAIIDQQRDMDMTQLSASISDLHQTMDQIHGLKSKVASKELGKVELREMKAQAAQAKLMDMKRKGEPNVNARLAKVRSELEGIRKEKDAMLEGRSGKNAKAIKLLADFSALMDGTMSEKEFRNEWRSGNADQINSLISKANSFMHGEVQRVEERINDKGETVEVGVRVGGFLPALKGAVENARKNMVLQLEPRYGKEKAEEMAERLVDMKEIDKYYPHKNLLSLYWTMENSRKVNSAFISGDFSDVDTAVASAGKTGHILDRTAGSKNISRNSVNVLAAYGEEVIRYKHATQAAREMNEFISGLSKVDVIKQGRDKVAKGQKADDAYRYFDSVRKMLISYAHDMVDTRVNTLFDDAIGTAVAYQAMLKLTSPSTAALNRAEGVLHYMAWNGMRRGLKGFKDSHGVELSGIMKEAHTNFRPEDVLLQELDNMTVNELRKYLADYDIKDAKLLAKDRAQMAAQVAKKGVGRAATLGMSMWGWSKAENANRKGAFELGAAEALQYVKLSWEKKFLEGNVPDFMVKRYKLDTGMSRKAMLADFKKKYVIRQGYRAMFQTQFQYNLSQRNMLDKNSATKAFHMFQHYPRSLASAVGWAAYDLKNLSEVAGLRGIFRRTTKETLGGGYMMNQNAQYMLSVGMVHGIRQAIRMGAGVVLGQLATHPLQEIVQDLIGYFNDDTEDARHDRFYGRGIANEVTGPMYSDVMDAISLAALKLGVESGELPWHLGEISRLTFGFRPDATLLSEQGRRDYQNIWDVTRETFLWDAAAIYPKSVRMVHALQSGNGGNVIKEAARAMGVRQDFGTEPRSKKERDEKS